MTVADDPTAARSPFAPKVFPTLPAVDGVLFATAETGLKYRDRPDVLLARIEGPDAGSGPSAAGALTQSKTRAAPVDWCAARLAELADEPADGPVALIVNAGNANAFTGEEGAAGVARLAKAAAAAAGADAAFVASTGVIGEPLDDGRIRAALNGLAGGLAPTNWRSAATAIMTTDTYPKAASTTARLDGATAVLAGVAKGSGMIAPDMATMLAFVFTDADVAPAVLRKLTRELADRTFNAVTVDGDTSTSDTLLVFATGRSGAARIENGRSRGYRPFRRALERVFQDLALQIVRDGEGVSKIVAVRVAGAASDKSARRIAKAIANSPLVKTAWAGGDPNWGRIVMAVGKAGEPADRDRMSIRYGPHPVAEEGRRATAYDEATLADYMAGDALEMTVDVGVGKGAGVAWGCDLTHGYVTINADYRS